MNAALTGAETDYETRKEYIEANIKDEKERAKQLAALEKSHAAEVRRIKTEQFIANKVASGIESVINTAVAITKVIDNPILAFIVGALGAIQTAFIAGQPFQNLRVVARFIQLRVGR